MTATSARPGPLRRYANHIVALFLLIQAGLLLRALVPWQRTGGIYWPWNMFDRPSAWERVLLAVGKERTGPRRELPLHRLFGYARGATSLHVYQQLDYLDDPAKVSEQAAFAEFLARRMSQQRVELSAIELRWLSTNIETGEAVEQLIGTFDVGARP